MNLHCASNHQEICDEIEEADKGENLWYIRKCVV